MPVMTGPTNKPDDPSRTKSFPRRSVHGRRRGRRLRPGLQRLLNDLLPQLRIELPGPGARLDLAKLFGQKPRDIWLEIGFGGGEHLAWQAERHPDIGFLGAEHFVNGLAGLLRFVRDHDLANVRLLQGDGRDLLDVLPNACLGRVFIFFPDPWRKLRHHKRRIVRHATLDRLADLMKDGAELRIATDHTDYLRWILECAGTHPAFCWLARGPADWRRRPEDWPPTRYELKALGQGRKPVYLRFERRPRGTG